MLLGPVFEIAKWTQILWAELIEHLTQLATWCTKNRKRLAINHARVPGSESAEKYFQMRQRRTRVQVSLIDMNGFPVWANKTLVAQAPFFRTRGFHHLVG